ncbi:MAG: HAMP domain-containing sensor histidine kinase [Rubricoccaceae bacterium]|nr:HAMP domain-containing sensor histidine kinase [Rubricoccaceae bacterium]
MDPLLDTAPCGFFSVNDDGTVVRANATLRNYLGAETLVGHHVDALLSRGAKIFYQTHVFPLLRVEGEVNEVYLSLRTAGGDDLPVLLNATRHTGNDGAVNDAVVVPMRRRNQFESELLQAKHAAEEASRARARFLSVLSHDLRAPLSAINLAAHMLAEEALGPVTDAQRRDLDRIRESSAYVLRLVTDLLNFSRVDAGRVTVRVRATALSDVLDRATDIVEPLAAEAGVAFIRTPQAATGAVLADPERLQQVLLNLLTNAVKFTDPGGHIRVETEETDDLVRLHVRDTGRGIAPEEIERVFEPFVQLAQPDDAPRDGAGLGLAISRELVRAMGGDLTVESVLGEGSSFTIALPAAPAGEPAVS